MIDCKDLANKIKDELRPLVSKNKGLVIIQVGKDPASSIYVRNKVKDCDELGIPVKLLLFGDETTTEDLVTEIKKHNKNSRIAGIIVQLPLPSHIDENTVLNSIADAKDVDGFKATSKFTPATPRAVLEILDYIGVNVSGKKVCLIGKGKTVGRPLVPLLLDRGATLIVCGSNTSRYDRVEAIKYSDIVISAVGKPDMVKNRPMYSNNPVIIDVGISRIKGRQVGDVSETIQSKVALCTPWVNGVGLITRVCLLKNLLGV